MNLDNFLTSGHDFNNDEYRDKSKFILINSAILIILVFISVLTIFLLQKEKYMFSFANVIYIFLGILGLFALRQNRKNYQIVINTFAFSSLILIVVAIIINPTEQVRIAWFIDVIIISFFLNGKKLGFIISFLSLMIIVVLNIYLDMEFLQGYTFVLAIFIVSLSIVLINLYEHRERIARKRLNDMNMSLELRVKEEIKKRITIYEESNSELKKSAKKLYDQKNAYKNLAHYDTLTGLPNRILFYDRLEDAILNAEQNNSKFVILFFDLDNFKEINDSFGHDSGDDVLKIIAKRFKNKIGKLGSLARLGGDEFTLLMEECDDISKIGNMSENLIEVLNEPIYILEHELYVTVSIGISLYPNDGKDMATLLKHADSAMYSAKKNGCNLYHFYKQEMTNQALERVTLETRMRKALDNDEFIVYYQPIVNGRTGELIGLEALVRWLHPENGLLTPDKFIHFAESTSIIVPLGERVLEIVSTQIKSWNSIGFNPNVSVNLSINQLRHKSLIPFIKSILAQITFRSNWLEFEITEGYAMQKPEQSIAVLNQIKALGVKLSIDDFGTGYSSLSHLKKLPVDKLKIDKSFIGDLPNDEDDKVLVTTIISMAKSMNLDVVAEGVETEQQREFLERIDCIKMQGYLFSKPISRDDISKKYIDRKFNIDG